MNAFELNKIAGAFLGVLTFAMLASFASELVFKEKAPKRPGYELAVPQAQASAPAAPAKEEPIAVRLASADAGRGQNLFRQCTACHTPDKGGANRVGPNMWDVVSRVKGAVQGFGYSAATRERAAKGETWDFAALDAFIANPRGYMPGTSMAFGGIANPAQRADLIAYLRSLADTPAPLPQP